MGKGERVGRRPGQGDKITPTGISFIEDGISRAEMTLDKFCAAVGIHKSTWYRWKSGETSSTPLLARIEQVLGMKPGTISGAQPYGDRLMAAFVGMYRVDPVAAGQLVGRAETMLEQIASTSRPLADRPRT